jgi:signal transduction histidine kinase
VRVEYQLRESLPLVHGDRAMLAEALGNLITNAVQAMPEGGVLALQSAEGDDCVELAVADTGVGIEKEKLDQVFDLYYTTKPKGGGLGLPLALRAVELNRGTIKIESQVGKGTTCKINLPVAKVETQKDVPIDAA